MTDALKLQTLIELSQSRNDAATRRLGQLNQQQVVEQKKLETLLQFRREYQGRFHQATQAGIDPARVTNFQNFLNRLEEAVQQQQGAMERASQSLEQGRETVHQTWRSLKSFETLAERLAEQLRQHQNRLDQKLQDEQSNRFVANRTAAHEHES